MADDNNTQALAVVEQAALEDRYVTDVPGRQEWFDRGSPQYETWVTRLNRFVAEIDPSKPQGREIVNDVIDTILESETPTGILGFIQMGLKVTKAARKIHKRRKIWNEVVASILQVTFTAPSDPSLAFRFTYRQVQIIWQSVDQNEPFTSGDYEKLYANLTTKFNVGKLRNKVIQYPNLERYVESKLRQYKDSYLKFMVDA